MKNNIQNKIGWILQEKYNGKLTAAAKKDIERLKAGEPVDYIIGFVEFLGCKIDLSKKTLIPRFETEYWTEEVIGELRIANGKLRIIDIFSGSGCIGVAILKRVKNAEVVFADSEQNCVEQIEINCKINKINPDRYKIIQSDVFDKVVGKFDYIVANPPYIAIKRKNKVQASVLKHEPKAALFGDADGMLFIEKFLSGAPKFLNPGGKIFMEFDPLQKNKIDKILTKANYKNWEFRKDQYGKIRWIKVEF